MRPLFFILTSCLLVISLSNLSATTITSKRSGIWENSNTWTGGIIPTENDIVVISCGNNVSTNDDRTCAGIIIMGTLSMDGGDNLMVNGNVSGFGTLLTGSETRTISLTGDWSFNGTSFGNGVRAIFTGSNQQIFSGKISTGKCSLTINKTSGSVTLNSNISVNGTLTLTSGNIVTTDKNFLVLGPLAVIDGGNAISFIDGPLCRLIASAGSKTLSFPIGSAGIYHPVDFNFNENNSTLTAYTVEIVHSAPPSLILPASLSGVSTIRYYTISKSCGSAFTNGSVSLRYSDADGVTDDENLRIAKSNGSEWQDLGPVTGGSAGQILSTMTFSSLTDNIFVLANSIGGSNPMPVELTSFSAAAVNNGVKLRCP